MFTDEELRQACRELARDAPDTATMVARLPSRPARRAPSRLIAPALTALVVGALAATLAIVLPGQHSDRPAPGADAGPTSSFSCLPLARPHLVDLSLRHVSGLADFSTATTACSGYASRELDSTTGGPIGEVRQYRKGEFDTRLLHNARKVSGQGIHGYVLPLALRRLSPNEGEPACTGKVVIQKNGHQSDFVPCTSRLPIVLAWRYATDSWALVIEIRNYSGAVPYFGNDPDDRLLTVAAALDTAHPTPVRVPVAFDHLPARVRTLGVGIYRSGTGALLSATVSIGAVGVPRCDANIVCSVGEVSLSPRRSRPHLTGKPIPVGARTAYLLDKGTERPDIPLKLWTGQWLVTVAQTADRPLPDNDLVAIARAARFAGTAPSTWFRVEDAFPA